MSFKLKCVGYFGLRSLEIDCESVDDAIDHARVMTDDMSDYSPVELVDSDGKIILDEKGLDHAIRDRAERT